MPAKSEKQRRAMWAAAEGKSTLGIPKKVGKEFVGADVKHEPVSEKQRRAMYAAAEGKSKLGIPEKIGEEFVGDKSISKGASQEEISKKIGELINEGKDRDQAAAIAYNEAGKSRGDEDGLIDELQIAKAIRSGELSSPQQYENIWLFDVRITGTGVSYRDSLDEYVFRDPEYFLSDEFVERCDGLPLTFEHPDKNILNTDEYRERSIGNVILPYVSGDEVRGIAKVLDSDAAELMQMSHISTSPVVVFRDEGSTETVEIDGKTVLIEGKPSLVDSLAICENGVWDKGGDPDGVKLEGDEMNEELEEEKMPAWADALMKRMDALEGKGDAEEGGSEEAEEEMRQAAELETLAAEERAEGEREEKEAMEEEGAEEKADAESDEEREEGFEKAAKKEEEERADSQRKSDKAMKDKIAALEARIAGLTKPISNKDRDALSVAQARADSVAQLFGDSVNQPLHGETPIAYRKRLADKFKKYSDELKGVRLDSLDETSFGVIENKIYADAQAVARNPENASKGVLIPMIHTDASGRQITEYTGDIGAWMDPFNMRGQNVKINRAH